MSEVCNGAVEGINLNPLRISDGRVYGATEGNIKHNG